MVKLPRKFILLFVLLVLVQVFVIDNIVFWNNMHPQVYVLFVLFLPANIPGWLLLSVSFLLGLSMDIFSDTLAIHTAATVFMGFCRPGTLNMITRQLDHPGEKSPTFSTLGSLSLIAYSAILIFLHHLVLFFLEIFRLSEFGTILLRVLFSTIISIVLVIIGYALLDRTIRS